MIEKIEILYMSKKGWGMTIHVRDGGKRILEVSNVHLLCKMLINLSGLLK